MLHRPLRRPRALVAVACVALLAGCATLAGANYVSIEDEWQLGRQLEAEINQELTLVNDPTIDRYIEQMGQAMVRQTNMAQLPWRFHVVRDARVNAFNIPGGVVYIHTGLIAQAGSAGELAGAVAHEISHGVARHGTRRLSQMQEANLLAGVLLGQNPGTIGQIAAQVAATGAFAQFSRADEREADALGVQLMVASGYDPEGLARMLERLMADGSGGGGFFSTHPTSAERVANVRRDARAQTRPGLRMNDSGFAAVRSRAAQLR